jgi:hypothetical protein
VLEELKKWTDDPHFNFPEWITPGMQFVTETNLSNFVSLYDYVKDIYSQSPKYLNYAIQTSYHAGSDLVFSLVVKSDDSKNVILSTIFKKEVPESKAFKACLEFQYMKRISNEKKRPNDKGLSELQSKKMKLGPANIDHDDRYLYWDRNFDLDYDEILKSYQISKNPKLAELHHKIAGLMTVNKISGNVVDKRKCIHILVELPHRSVSSSVSKQRPDIFRYDKNGNLIVIVDDRNVNKFLEKRWRIQ